METLHVSHPRETLLLVPHLLGFRPRDCVVLLAIDRKDQSNCASPIVKIDVRSGIDDDFITAALDFVVDFEVTTLSINWYGGSLAEMIDDELSLNSLHEGGLVIQEHLNATYGSETIGFVSVHLTDYDEWATCQEIVGDTYEEARIAGHIHSYTDLDRTQLAAELVYEGSAPLGAEPEGAWPRLPWVHRARSIEESQKCVSPMSGARIWGNSLTKFVAYEERTILPGAASSMLGGARRIGRLNAALRDVTLRDRILLYAVNSRMTAVAALTPERTEKLLIQATGDEVAETRIKRVIDLLSAAAMYSADDDGRAYAVVAYLYWWLGQGSKAADNVNIALASDPEYSLAKLVRHALDVQLPPPWFS